MYFKKNCYNVILHILLTSFVHESFPCPGRNLTPFPGKTGLPTSHGRLEPQWNGCRIVLPIETNDDIGSCKHLCFYLQMIMHGKYMCFKNRNVLFIITNTVLYICLKKLSRVDIYQTTSAFCEILEPPLNKNPMKAK